MAVSTFHTQIFQTAKLIRDNANLSPRLPDNAELSQLQGFIWSDTLLAYSQIPTCIALHGNEKVILLSQSQSNFHLGEKLV